MNILLHFYYNTQEIFNSAPKTLFHELSLSNIWGKNYKIESSLWCECQDLLLYM